MGSEHSHNSLQITTNLKKLTKFKHNSKLSTTQKFAIYKKFAMNHADIKNSLHKPRVIFVSLFALKLSWESIPFDILYHSIFCINSRKQWIFPNDNKISILESNASYITKYMHLDKMFIELLRCKEEQGLIIWMNCENINNNQKRNNESNGNINNNIKLVENWKMISNQLCCINDPITNKFYNPLKLSIHQYRNTINFQYVDEIQQIHEELETACFKFKSVMELLYQSNRTLIPMIHFDAKLFNNQSLQKYSMNDINNENSTQVVNSTHVDNDGFVYFE